MPQPQKWHCSAGLTKASCEGKKFPPANFFWAAGTSCGSNEQNSGLKVCGSFSGGVLQCAPRARPPARTTSLGAPAPPEAGGSVMERSARTLRALLGLAAYEFDNNQNSNQDFCRNSTDETSCRELAAAQGPQAVGHFTAQAHCSAVNCWDMRGACCKQGASGRPTCSMATHRGPTPFDISCLKRI